MNRLPTMLEVRTLGAEIVIECDQCRTVIDAVVGEWADMVRNEWLYNGPVVCWRCKAAKGATE